MGITGDDYKEEDGRKWIIKKKRKPKIRKYTRNGDS